MILELSDAIAAFIVRLTVGIARYSGSSFTPPLAAFP